MDELEELETLEQNEVETTADGIRLLKVSEIEVLEDVNPRTELNEKNINNLMAVEMEDLPPIIVALYEKRYINIDGHHRLESRKRNNEEKIKVIIETIDDMKEIKRRAFTTNVNHGMRLSAEEVRRFCKNVLTRDFEGLSTKEMLATQKQKYIKTYQLPKGAVDSMVTQLFFQKVIKGTEAVVS